MSEILDELRHFLSMDHLYSSGRVMGSMYTTPLPIAVEAHRMFIEANLGNPKLYPGTLLIAERVKDFLAGLLELHGGDIMFTSGGTEANINALWMARNALGLRRVYMGQSAHFSIRKAADLLELEIVEIELDDEYRMDLSDLEVKMTQPGIVIGVAGTTELGQIDPLAEIGEILEEKGGFFHVDAAFGGLVIPFLRELGYLNVPFTFSEIGAMDSMTVDPHKMLMSTIPLGSLAMRRADIINSIEFPSPYLTSSTQAGLLGTRASASIPSAYAAIRQLGHDGLKNVVRWCYDTTKYFASRLEEIGLELAIQPVMNILSARHERAQRVVELLQRRGWFISSTVHPPGLRFVIMPHITPEVVDTFIPILRDVLREVDA